MAEFNRTQSTRLPGSMRLDGCKTHVVFGVSTMKREGLAL